MTDDQGDGSVFEVSVGLVVLCALLLAAAYGLALVAECLTKNVATINSNDINVYFEHHSLLYRILVSAVPALVLLGGLWVFHWLFHRAGVPWLEALFVIAGIVLAALVPLDVCHSF